MPLPFTAPGLPSRRALLAGGIALAALVIGAVIALAVAPGEPEPTLSPTPEPSAEPTATPAPTAAPSASASPSAAPRPAALCPLSGMPIAEGYEPLYPALAVQVENDPAARPARNLNNADIIIEGTVEGDVTRFTGIFLCHETDGMTGPVRSARYYNIDLWQDLRVLTVGFGRSDGAHERFVRAGMPYPNGMEGWPWYQRYGSRAAPHNLYVDLEGMRDGLSANRALAALADRVGELRPPWQFDEDPALPDGGRVVEQIDIRTNAYWRFGFTWDPDEGAYRRSDAGVYIIDEATGDALAPTSVIVQWVTQETVFGDPDPAGNPRRLQHLVGSGEGVLYTLGRAFPIRWERPTAADGTNWTFADGGGQVEMPAGQVWWVILPVGSSLTES